MLKHVASTLDADDFGLLCNVNDIWWDMQYEVCLFRTLRASEREKKLSSA